MYTNCWSTLLSNKGNNSQTISNTFLRHKGTFAVPDSRVGSETKSHIQHERCTFFINYFIISWLLEMSSCHIPELNDFMFCHSPRVIINIQLNGCTLTALPAGA